MITNELIGINDPARKTAQNFPIFTMFRKLYVNYLVLADVLGGAGGEVGGLDGVAGGALLDDLERVGPPLVDPDAGLGHALL